MAGCNKRCFCCLTVLFLGDFMSDETFCRFASLHGLLQLPTGGITVCIATPVNSEPFTTTYPGHIQDISTTYPLNLDSSFMQEKVHKIFVESTLKNWLRVYLNRLQSFRKFWEKMWVHKNMQHEPDFTPLWLWWYSGWTLGLPQREMAGSKLG